MKCKPSSRPALEVGFLPDRRFVTKYTLAVTSESHFLFNTMSGISSLMRTDLPSAVTMLEQLSSLLRITLERGNARLIPLSDETEFAEVYLALQNRRFPGGACQEVHCNFSRVQPKPLTGHGA